MYCFSLESVSTLTYRLLAICSTRILNRKGSAQARTVVGVLSEQLGGWHPRAAGNVEVIHPQTWKVLVHPPQHPHRNGGWGGKEK